MKSVFNEINDYLKDPYNVRSLAPLGYDFLLYSAIGYHKIEYMKRLSKFEKDYDEHFQSSKIFYKYPHCITVPLSNDKVNFDDSLTSALFKRQSVRNFEGRKIGFNIVSFLLKLSVGIKTTKTSTEKVQKRMYPSGGGLFSCKVYVDVRNVEKLENGIYLYNPYDQSLQFINDDYNIKERSLFHNQSVEHENKEKASFEILISTSPHVALKKYGEHAWKVIMIEAGAILENLWLVGIGLGLSSCPLTSLNFYHFERYYRTNIKYELPLISLLMG